MGGTLGVDGKEASSGDTCPPSVTLRWFEHLSLQPFFIIIIIILFYLLLLSFRYRFFIMDYY